VLGIVSEQTRAAPRSGSLASIRSTLARGFVAHDRLAAFILAAATAAVVYAPRIKAGGLLVDDWALDADVHFPRAQGYTSGWAALESGAGSRIGAIPYWLASFTIFGSHTKYYLLLAGGLAVLLAFSIYLLLRELRFSIWQSMAIMVLTLVAPSIATERFWFTPSGSQLALALFFLGLTLALRAFDATGRSRLRLHVCSWLLYVASALYAEVALPLMVAAILVYITRAPLRDSLRRWAFDVPIVIVGYLATTHFVNETKGFGKLPSSMWAEHARLLADQALSIFTMLLVPFWSNRDGILIALAVLAVASALAWRFSPPGDRTRAELKRWYYVLLVCTVAIIGIYGTFVPGMLYYLPLGPGLATHINVATVAALAAGVFSVLMIARAVLWRVSRDLPPAAGWAASALVFVWLGVVIFDGGRDVRRDAHVWAVAAAHDYHELHVITATIPKPLANSTVFTFGEAGTVAPGLPVFFSSFELVNAIKIAYHRGDVAGYPVVNDDDVISCTPPGIVVSTGNTPLNHPSPYGRSYFLDVPSARYALISSAGSCRSALATFHSGPYSVEPPLSWSY
jgi:hypothetical protein